MITLLLQSPDASNLISFKRRLHQQNHNLHIRRYGVHEHDELESRFHPAI